MNGSTSNDGRYEIASISTDGTTLTLHNNSGGSANNVITTYDTQTVPVNSLNALNGKAPNGTWRLIVKDLAAQGKVVCRLKGGDPGLFG